MNNNKESNGISLGGVLVIIFVVLKLTGLITWSWWWVFSPIWIVLLIIAAVLLIGLIIIAIKELLKYKR